MHRTGDLGSPSSMDLRPSSCDDPEHLGLRILGLKVLGSVVGVQGT